VARADDGVRILTSVVSGLLLPRMVFAMDASQSPLWHFFATLSGDATF
jgi:hypothetical protein